ncbi:Lrp/AsnC family transcriptional regulator [Candidatus Micrarchaeota archaeon]|nr:Lrp/AsnC family transcriptional regulator [Candidatus Micrarchaeota archaeon]
MQQSSIKLSKSEILFLKALLADGHKNDAKIAREIGISKATASRIRKRLETDEVLIDYMPIINLDGFGINLYAVVLFQWRDFNDGNKTSSMEKEFSETPQVVYLSAGESSTNFNYVAMLGFFDMTDYHAFFNEFRKKYQQSVGKIEVFFIPSKQIIKQDFTDLAKLMLKKSEVQMQ